MKDDQFDAFETVCVQSGCYFISIWIEWYKMGIKKVVQADTCVNTCA